MAMILISQSHPMFSRYECNICHCYAEVDRIAPTPPFCAFCQTEKYRWYYGLAQKPEIEAQNVEILEHEPTEEPKK